MVLNNNITTHEPDTSLVDALVSSTRHHPPGAGRDHTVKRVA